MQFYGLYRPLSTSLLIVPGLVRTVAAIFDGPPRAINLIRMRYTVTFNVTGVDEDVEQSVSNMVSRLHCDIALVINQNTILGPFQSAGDTLAFQRSGFFVCVQSADIYVHTYVVTNMNACGTLF